MNSDIFNGIIGALVYGTLVDILLFIVFDIIFDVLGIAKF
jgi:hypothetical protein